MVHVQMIKVDDGTVLAEKEISIRASDTKDDKARAESVANALKAASQDLLQQSSGKWNKVVLDQPRFSVMFTDLTEEEAKLVSRHLQSFLNYGSRVYLKTWFGNVAIFNVDTDRALAGLERAIIDFKQFDLRISDRQGKRITVDVQHLSLIHI